MEDTVMPLSDLMVRKAAVRGKNYRLGDADGLYADGVGKVFTHHSTGPGVGGRPPPSPTLNSRARLEEDYRCLGADAPGRLGGWGASIFPRVVLN